jgi:hypothetical protein
MDKERGLRGHERSQGAWRESLLVWGGDGERCQGCERKFKLKRGGVPWDVLPPRSHAKSP